MRYDQTNLFLLRFPQTDETLVNIIRMAAVIDGSLQVNAIVAAFDMPEMKIDLISPDKMIGKHFLMYRPDVLMLNTDMLGKDYLEDATRQIKQVVPKMPFLVTIGVKSPNGLRELVGEYAGWYHLPVAHNPLLHAESLKRYFMQELVTREALREKIRSCVRIALRAMHCGEREAGFRYMELGAMEVLEKPFLVFTSQTAFGQYFSELTGAAPQNINTALRHTAANALEKMTDKEREQIFEGVIARDDGKPPTYMEFIYAAAKLTYQPCRKIFAYLNDQPLLQPSPRKQLYITK